MTPTPLYRKMKKKITVIFVVPSLRSLKVSALKKCFACKCEWSYFPLWTVLVINWAHILAVFYITCHRHLEKHKEETLNQTHEMCFPPVTTAKVCFPFTVHVCVFVQAETTCEGFPRAMSTGPEGGGSPGLWTLFQCCHHKEKKPYNLLHSYIHAAPHWNHNRFHTHRPPRHPGEICLHS